ncbi:MAG: KpsF/GutQ family sugar-phosphate isomerase [Verrucomicrobiae bacterium]|nr:KpsF/GutQ family sugar-phosphate isomerase [Verrucomicrobiae bacterium]MCP5551383.1 KpsF/GutQ family sugar-phosphate isomerase [Akkermansiaceae bacterium]
MDNLEKARRVIQLEIEELQRLLERIGAPFDEAVRALLDAIEAGGKIVVVGVGKSGNIGQKIAATLNSTGAPAAVLDCQDALHGDLGLVTGRDLVLALSYSGETNELLDLLPHLKRRGARIVSVTGNPDSTLGRMADTVLDIAVRREACPLNLAPTSSTTNMLVLGDALAMVLLEARGFGKEDFADLHPGGALGRALLTRVEDIMRTGNDLARVAPTDSVHLALERMTRARAGAVVVVAEDGTLDGIFTQGDFARAFQAHQGDIAHRPVGDFTTRHPIVIDAGKLAAEALHILEEHRIDDLVVVNEKNEPLGLIDTQDLARLRIV